MSLCLWDSTLDNAEPLKCQIKVEMKLWPLLLSAHSQQEQTQKVKQIPSNRTPASSSPRVAPAPVLLARIWKVPTPPWCYPASTPPPSNCLSCDPCVKHNTQAWEEGPVPFLPPPPASYAWLMPPLKVRSFPLETWADGRHARDT